MTATKRLAMFVVAAIALLFITTEAHAKIGVVVVGGAANDHDRGQVRAAIEQTLLGAGWTLSPTPLAKRDADAILGCKDTKAPWTCVPPSLGTGGVQTVLVVNVAYRQSDAGAPMIVLTGQLIGTDTQSTAAGSQYCEQCAGDKLNSTASELTEQLMRDLAVRNRRTMIQVRSTPPGAEVKLDGQSVGVTDQTFNTFPGVHLLVIQKPGFERVLEDVFVEEGQTATVAHTLKPSSIERGVRTQARSRIVPAILIGAGAVMVVGGTYVSWTEESSLAGPQDKYLYNSPAIAVAAVGAIAIGAGIYLWQRKPRTGSTPTVSVTHGAAVAGWATSF
jgi:hypothetical protein